MKCNICNTPLTGNPRKNNCQSPQCIAERNKIYHYADVIRKAWKLKDKKNLFTENKEKYADKVIEYEGQKVYIGLAKEPLMKNENGIGFQGVLLQTENRELIQCSECGAWFNKLTHSHLKRHGLTTKTYRLKFGLNVNHGLISDSMSNDYSRRMTEQNTRPGFHSNHTPPVKKATSRVRTRESQNLKGTCPEQLKAEMVEFVLRTHRLPSNSKRGGFRHSVYRHRFGSMNNALRLYGLPTRQCYGSIIEHYFPDGTYFTTKSGKGYEELYQLMLKKCPVLTQK